MILSIKGLAVAGAVLMGGSILLVGLAAMIGGVSAVEPSGRSGYFGADFLLAFASIYPGYKGTPELGDTIVGTLYGLVGGAVAGALVAWIHNRFARPRATS